MTWGEIITLLAVALGLFFLVITKMRQTEKGRKSVEWLWNIFKKKDKPMEIINTGRKQWIPPEKII